MKTYVKDRLLELLEDLTTGTEEETQAFMKVCVDTVQRYPAGTIKLLKYLNLFFSCDLYFQNVTPKL